MWSATSSAHELWPVDLEVVAGHAEGLEVRGAGSVSNGSSTASPPTRSAVTKTVCHEPVQRKLAAARCTRGSALAHARVVVGRDGALLHEVRLGRVAADGVGRLGIGASRRRQRVRRRGASAPLSVTTWAIAPAADVAGDAVADAVSGLEGRADVGPAAVDAVAEAQRRRRRRARPRPRTPARRRRCRAGRAAATTARSPRAASPPAPPRDGPSAGRRRASRARSLRAREHVQRAAVEAQHCDGDAVGDRPGAVAAANDRGAGTEREAALLEPVVQERAEASATPRSAASAGVAGPSATACVGAGSACVTGASASVGRKRTGTGSGGSRSHGSQPPAATAARTGSGTSPSVSPAIVRPWSASTTLPQASPTTRPGCSSTEMQSGNGSASASSQAISVTVTGAFVGGSAKSPPDGSTEPYDVRQADGGALRRVGVVGVAGERAGHLREHEHVARPSAPGGRRRASPRSRRAGGSSRRRPTSRSRSARASRRARASSTVSNVSAPAASAARCSGPPGSITCGTSGTRVSSGVPRSRATPSPPAKTRTHARAFEPSWTR